MTPPRRTSTLAALTALATLAGCDLPSGSTTLDQTLRLDGETFRLSVAEILPDGVTLNDDSTAFRVDTPGAASSTSLAELCPECGTVEGREVPKPAFTATLELEAGLPPGVTGATLAGGSLDLEVGHSFDFDPLRPAADPEAERGYLVVRVLGAGGVVARDSISGEDTAFPAGTPLVPVLELQPVAVAGALALELELHSPAGDDFTVRSADTVGVTLRPSSILVSEATVAPPPVTVELPPAGFEPGLDPELLDRIRSGAVIATVANPFDVSGTVDLTFAAGGHTVPASFPVRPGEYQERVEFTGTEIRDLLGEPSVEVSAVAALEAVDGTVTVTPTQELVVVTEIEVVVRITG